MPILLTIGIIIIGCITRICEINSFIKRREFTLLFQNNFIDLVNSFLKTGKMQKDLYAKCIHDVDAIQEELGDDGVIAGYVDQLHRIQGQNYQLFVNIIPEIRDAERMIDNSLIVERVSQLIGICDDSLRRHIGNLDRAIDRKKKGIFNPFILFREGVRTIIGLPILVLSWSGLVSIRFIGTTSKSILFRFVTGVITIVGLISSIITIILGWNEALKIFKNFLNKL